MTMKCTDFRWASKHCPYVKWFAQCQTRCISKCFLEFCFWVTSQQLQVRGEMMDYFWELGLKTCISIFGSEIWSHIRKWNQKRWSQILHVSCVQCIIRSIGLPRIKPQRGQWDQWKLRTNVTSGITRIRCDILTSGWLKGNCWPVLWMSRQNWSERKASGLNWMLVMLRSILESDLCCSHISDGAGCLVQLNEGERWTDGCKNCLCGESGNIACSTCAKRSVENTDGTHCVRENFPFPGKNLLSSYQKNKWKWYWSLDELNWRFPHSLLILSCRRLRVQRTVVWHWWGLFWWMLQLSLPWYWRIFLCSGLFVPLTENTQPSSLTFAKQNKLEPTQTKSVNTSHDKKGILCDTLQTMEILFYGGVVSRVTVWVGCTWGLLQDTCTWETLDFVWNIFVFPEMLVAPKSQKRPNHTNAAAIKKKKLENKATKGSTKETWQDGASRKSQL